jgi:hypothetical protein
MIHPTMIDQRHPEKISDSSDNFFAEGIVSDVIDGKQAVYQSDAPQQVG